MVCAGMGGIRVWNVASLQEALRVELPGVVCHCCCVSPSLHTIVTGEKIQIHSEHITHTFPPYNKTYLKILQGGVMDGCEGWELRAVAWCGQLTMPTTQASTLFASSRMEALFLVDGMGG